MYGNAQTSDNLDRGAGRVQSAKDAPKLAVITAELNDAHGQTWDSLEAMSAALDRIDGSVPEVSAPGQPKAPAVTLVGSLAEQASFARSIADKARSIVARLQAIG